MKQKNFILLVFILSSLHSGAQKPVGKFSETDIRNFSTILNAISFLKNNKTPLINLNDSTTKLDHYTVYDSLINKYFDLSYLKDSVKDEKNPFNVRVNFQKCVLYNIDHFLDILPPDSVCFSPLRETSMANDSVYYPANSLVAFIPFSQHPFYSDIILFNKDGKIYSVSPLINFHDENKDLDIEGFYMRQKGYKEIKSSLWKP